MKAAEQPSPLRTFARAAIERNPAAVQLLGLCPLLAVSNTLANAAGLALASAGVLIGSAMLAAGLRRLIPPEVRLPCHVLLIAAFTTVAMLLMQAYAFELYQRIALFVQIIVTNCMILAHIEQAAAYADRASGEDVTPLDPEGAPGHAADGSPTLAQAFLSASGAAAGFAAALLVLGGVREVLTLGFPLAGLAPGAFLVAGLLLALLNARPR